MTASRELDANELLIRDKTATCFMEIGGVSMLGCWVRPKDIAVVECSIEPKAGVVVVAVLAWTCRAPGARNGQDASGQSGKQQGVSCARRLPP